MSTTNTKSRPAAPARVSRPGTAATTPTVGSEPASARTRPTRAAQCWIASSAEAAVMRRYSVRWLIGAPVRSMPRQEM